MTDPDPFAPAAAAGIHRLAIPTPFAVGRVNVYLIEDQPLTLVDAGPNSGTGFDALTRGLEALGHALEDIGLVILTHQHIDHLGLVGLVASRSGADVAAIDAAVPSVERFSEEAQVDDDFARDVMLRHGISEDVVSALQSVSRTFRAWGARADVTRVLADGDVLTFRDRRLQALYRPGHSPSDTVFLDADRKFLFAALLGHISSNPLITRPRDRSEGHHRPPLVDRRPPRPAQPSRGQAVRADRRASPQRLRAGPGAVGEHRGDPGLPHPQRGAGPHRQ